MPPRIFAVLAAVAAAITVVPAAPAYARDTNPRAAPADVSRSTLPKEAQQTLATIEKSGPFAYPKDGVTFGNRERVLPGKVRGFYLEYTVKTPGERTRGARRIVCGGNQEGAQTHSAEPCYYSDDHYATFARIKSL